MKRVLVLKAEWLPLSATFILDHLRSLTTYRPTIGGSVWLEDGLDVSGYPALRLPEGRIGVGLEHLGWASRKVRRELDAIDPDIVHVHFGDDAVRYAPYLNAAGKPVFVTLHGYDIQHDRAWYESGKGGWTKRSYPRRLLDLADEGVRFLAVSEAIRRRAIEYGIPESSVSVHYLGVDTDRFTPGPIPLADRPKQILFVGRLVEKKGAAYLLQAFERVRNAVPDARLLLIGDGPERDALHTQASALGDAVAFAGAQPSQVVRAAFDQSRVCCLPSIRARNGDAEGLPIVVMESQACGVPVVASAEGAHEAVRHGETGFLFAERDVDTLAAQLIDLLQDDRLSEALSAEGVAHMRARFRLSDRTRILESLYESAYP
jgi:glycosyltransferase involved in cell wall biosynthesis